MDIHEVMDFLGEVYGTDKLEPFKGLKGRAAYYHAYSKQQELAKQLTDDDYLFGSAGMDDIVLYRTIMIAWEKTIKNKDLGYNFPDAPVIDLDGDPSVITGRVDTWASAM